MHGLGLLSLTVIGGAAAFSVSIIVGTLDENWPRIIAALRGQTGLPIAPPQPFRQACRPVAAAVPEGAKMRDAA